MDGHLDYHFLVIMNNADMIICIQVFMCIHVSIFLDANYVPVKKTDHFAMLKYFH